MDPIVLQFDFIASVIRVTVGMQGNDLYKVISGIIQ